MTSILVTGIGGTRSIAVLKALKMAGEYTVIGTDANYFNPGSFQCDKSYIIPFASDPDYIPRLEKIIIDEDVKVIFATVEKEVAFLATQKDYLQEKYGLTVVVPDKEILDICFDKYKTQEFLKEHGFNAIPCIYADDRQAMQKFANLEGFPLIRKPVFGYGSKGLSIIETQSQLDELEPDDAYVLQKFITNDDNEKFYNLELNEYTAEVFVHANGTVAGGIIIKRALRGGETIAGYLVKDESIVERLSKIALATGIRGPVNFQFRTMGGEIYVFEINPLFSGTTAIRAKLGFNSVGMAANGAIESVFETVEQDTLESAYFMRYLEEVYIDPESLQLLKTEHYINNEDDQ